jgi:hypothetical protein
MMWAEAGAKAILALVLMAAPRSVQRLLGLPEDASTFWQRYLGVILAGLAIAIAIGLVGWTNTGLGLAGQIAINITAAFGLASMIVLGPAMPTWRGRSALWLAAIALLLVALFEISLL